jgi:hypothetical protein
MNTNPINNKWRVVLAVVVVFVVGAGAGALGEHARLKRSSNKKSTTTPTTSRTVPADLFGAKAKQACPTLKQLSASEVAAYKALYAKTPWKTSSAALVTQYRVTAKAYRTLMAFAPSPAGKATLRFLAGYATRLGNAVGKATSVATFVKASKAQQSPRSVRGTKVVARAVTTCAAA